MTRTVSGEDRAARQHIMILESGVLAMFGKRKKTETIPFDKSGKIPVIRSSICTGEQVAGFKDAASGRFEELMLVRDGKDLAEFLRRYQVEERELKREW